MNKLLQMVGVGKLRHNQLEVIGMLDKGPVVINSPSLPVGVLVHPHTWDRLMALIEDQQDITARSKLTISLQS